MTDDTESAPFHVLDLGDVVENRLRTGFCIHGRSICLTHIHRQQKKRRKLDFEEFCPL